MSIAIFFQVDDKVDNVIQGSSFLHGHNRSIIVRETFQKNEILSLTNRPGLKHGHRRHVHPKSMSAFLIFVKGET